MGNIRLSTIVIGRVGACGSVHVVEPPAWITDNALTLQVDHKTLELHYVAKALRLRNLGQLANQSAQPLITGTQVGVQRLPAPPLPEQTAIVRFLDYADRRIRRYIRAKRKLIALLEEQKQAIIHQAVTGRIDIRTGKPYPVYKPSGVEWLEGVPEHWEVLPLKRIGKFNSGAGFPISAQGNTDYELLFVKVSDMNRSGNEREIINSANTVSRDIAQELGAQVFKPNTIIFPKVGGALLTNKRRVLARQACIDNNLMGCIVTGADAEFTFHILEWLDLARLAKPGPVPAISEGEVREIRITLPPPPEQTAIVRFLDHAVADINNAVDKAGRQIEFFLEYRTRFIADVVTGKLDVREAAAALPEVDPLEAEDEIDDAIDADAEEAAHELDAVLEEAEA